MPSAKSKASRNDSATSKKSQSPVRSSSPSSRPQTSSAKRNKSSSKTRSSDSSMNEGKQSSATNRRVNLRSADLLERGMKSVAMRGQGMTVVPATVINNREIAFLDMSSNNLRIIPPEIKRLQNLVMLDVSKNGLRCLHANDYTGFPKEICSLPHLEILLISECNLPFVPPAIWKCANIKVLDISRNKINVLVPEVGNLEKLQHLNAQQTSIATLPPEIAYCQDLEEILLWGNVIESLPDTLKELPKLSYLAINYRSFCFIVDSYMEGLLRKGQIQSEHIPPVLFEMPNLDILDLQETRINNLPDKCVGKLKEFYLGKNFFHSMPKVIMTLDSLRVLDISGNMISIIPSSMGQLTNLKTLHLNDNNIEIIPSSMGMLTNLEELAMGGNKLRILPTEIGNMQSLKTLILDRNAIQKLPDNLIHLEKLETLDLTDNKLTALPLNFCEMKSIKQAHTYYKYRKHGLWLHENPLQTPPVDIWQTVNPQKIFTYLRRLQIMKTENLQRQKIIVIGESQCGKTSLVRTMTTSKSALTDGIVDTTAGVDFLAWKTDNDVDFLINDFGGSRMFLPVQAMLLDPKAIYLLVYDHRKYTPQTHHEAIGQWLEMILIMVPSAVVKVVGTQSDQCYQGIVESVRNQVQEKLQSDYDSYQQKLRDELERVEKMMEKAKEEDEDDPHLYDQLKKQKFHLMYLMKTPLRLQPQISVVSSAPGIAGIHDLINEIELMAVNKELFPHGQRYVPPEWTDFRMALKLREDYCLPWTEVVDIASQFEIHKSMVPNVVHYLYDIGELLWFHQNPHLKEVVFQRPIKLIEIVSGIFRHDIDTFMDFDKNRLFGSSGGFTRENFQQARDHFLKYGELSRPFLLCMWFFLRLDYEKLHFLLDLIPKLDLCYVIPQPDQPPRKSEFVPMMVIPSFNRDYSHDDRILELWPENTPDNEKELELSIVFPLNYPHGVYERLACRIQDLVLQRLDYSDWIFAEMDGSTLLLMRGLDLTNYDTVMRIKMRGKDLERLKANFGLVYAELKNIIGWAPGQTWYISLKTVNCEGMTRKQCFPMDVLLS